MRERLRPFFATLGEVVVEWNRAEEILKMILVALCGANPKTWILTAELGNVGLENAVKSATADLAPDEFKDHIDHTVKWFSRLREFRNYYIHGVQRVTMGDGENIGLIGQVSAKTALTWHQEALSLNRLQELLAKIREFIAFASTVELHLDVTIKKESRVLLQLPPLPQMPPLPDILVKPHRYLQGDEHPRAKPQNQKKPKPQSRKR
jgi:hypothetical protein